LSGVDDVEFGYEKLLIWQRSLEPKQRALTQPKVRRGGLASGVSERIDNRRHSLRSKRPVACCMELQWTDRIVIIAENISTKKPITSYLLRATNNELINV